MNLLHLASQVPSGQSIGFGALALIVATLALGGVWKVFTYMIKTSSKAAILEVVSDRFDALDGRLDHLHECFERRLAVVEARESSTLVDQVRRLADAAERSRPEGH